MKIYVNKLHEKDGEELFKFETENRAFFETLVPSRGDEYYVYNRFNELLSDLLTEQKEGISYFYLIKDEWNRIVGRINLVDIDQENRIGHIGYRVGEAYLKMGVASKALEHLLHEAINLQVYEIHAKTTPENIGSQKVLEKNGFIPTTKDEEPNFVHFVWNASK
ncbi:GNAT family N-acetyltransferase [Bacillus sp. CGMCC 1.16607]|uniref:GNAT family N-acetyltransferase n=1 Tax=Bacillus sp. CGMCC 1.16607 TaxID=3351842 RepID=UPI00363EC96C